MRHASVGAHLKIVLGYNYTILLSNYFTEGFVHRGIPGSLFYLLRGLGPEPRVIVFHLFCAVWLCIPLAILCRRLARTEGRAWIWLLLVLVLAPQLFLAWARDVARADMLVAGFIAWALLACLGRRYLLAAVVLFVASQVHEMGIIYGGPLCVAVGFLDWRAEKLSPAQGVIALGLLALLLALATIAQKLLGATPQAMAHDMLAQSGGASDAYLPIYMSVGGLRTLASSACAMFSRPAGYLYAASVVVVFAIYGFVLPAFSRLRLGLMAFVGLLPLVFLVVIAIDYGRWLSLAVLNWWLMNAALQLRGVEPLSFERWPPRTSMAAGLLLLAMGPGDYNSGGALISAIGDRLWPPTPVGRLMDRCDPSWRSLVSPTVRAPS